jgi:hypothetical protein
LEEEYPNVRKSSISVVPQVSSLLTAGFVTGALMALGFVLFAVPGIIVTITFSLTVQVIMIERLGAFESLRRSRKLVANRWRKTLAVLLLVSVIMVATYIVGDFIVGLLGPMDWILTIIVRSIVISLGQPLQPIALTYLYYSMRLREEPFERPTTLPPVAPVVMPPTFPPPTYPAGYQPRFCYKCGQNLPPDAVFCPRCGNQVKS